MNGIKLIFIFTAIIFVVLNRTEGNKNNDVALSSLKAVQILMRHGDRQPEAGHTSGQLTQRGKKEMYDLGLYHRQRYHAHISSSFNPEEINFISSDTDRTIDSMLLFTRALYEDYNKAAAWSDGRAPHYEPISFETIPAPIDKYLQSTQPCPKLDRLSAETMTPECERFLMENHKFIEIYLGKTGDTNLLNYSLGIWERFGEMNKFWEAVVSNMTHNEPVEDWAVEQFKDPGVLRFKIDTNMAFAETPEAQMLYSGPFIKLILDNFENLNHKITYFMGHDRNMLFLLCTLGVWDEDEPLMPPTGSSIIFELHQDAQGYEDYIEVWYRKSIINPPRLLDMPRCRNPCLLSEFRRNFADLLPVDFERQCVDS